MPWGTALQGRAEKTGQIQVSGVDFWAQLPRWWQQKVVEPDCRETPVLKLSERAVWFKITLKCLSFLRSWKLNTHIPCDPVFLLLGIYQREIKHPPIVVY